MQYINFPLYLVALTATTFALASNASAQENTSGGISDLIVRPHAGTAAIDISGHAPSGSPLTVTLLVTYSREIPDVLMARRLITTEPSGTFAATVPLAPGNVSGSIVTVYVTAAAGAAAKVQYIPDAPNRGVVVPLEQLPRSVR